jgi:hypothetical protein
MILAGSQHHHAVGRPHVYGQALVAHDFDNVLRGYHAILILSQSDDLHFGQMFGLLVVFGSHLCPQRRHSRYLRVMVFCIGKPPYLISLP